jgi:hypothetical protein
VVKFMWAVPTTPSALAGAPTLGGKVPPVRNAVAAAADLLGIGQHAFHK